MAQQQGKETFYAWSTLWVKIYIVSAIDITTKSLYERNHAYASGYICLETCHTGRFPDLRKCAGCVRK